MKKEMINWLLKRRFDYFVTLNFNDTYSLDGAEKKLRLFANMLNAKILGRRWYSPKFDGQRVELVAFPEHFDTNTHYHVLLITPRNIPSRIADDITLCWQKVASRGTTDTQQIQDTKALIIKTFYAGKDAYKKKNYDRMVLI